MGFDLKQTLRLSQQLVMTPQLQQAIKLLQLNRLELVELLREEVMENPVLEETSEGEPDEEEKDNKKKATDTEETQEKKDGKLEEIKGKGEGSEDFDWESYIQNSAPSTSGPTIVGSDDLPTIESTYSRKASLQDHLTWQLKITSTDDKEILVGSVIIGNIDDDGYFRSSLEEIAKQADVSVDFAQYVLNKIQTFDPMGVGARDLKECLLLQTKNLLDGERVRRVIENHLHELENKNYKVIQKALDISFEEVVTIAKKISELEPKPGRPFYDTSAQYISPDIYVYKIGEEYVVMLNEDGMPKLKISSFYKNILMKDKAKAKTKEYIHEKLKSAIWLIRSIHQRQRTIFKVTESIVKFQKDFLEKGVVSLKPMVLKDVAQDIEMHESTVSRVTTNKYVHTPQGIYELKFFFNSSIKKSDGDSIASESVKDAIKKTIAAENPQKPLSDQDLVEILKKDNVEIARRTVAKYREMLQILPSSKRKKVY